MSTDRQMLGQDTPADPDPPLPVDADAPDTWQERPEVAAIQRRTVRMLICAQIVGGIGIGAGASMGALLAEQVTSSESLAGLARTSSTVGAAVVAIPLALLATRRGRSIALGLGWAIAAVGAVGLVVASVVNNTPLLIVGMLAFGAGTATNMQSRFAATDLAPVARRASTLSLVVWSTTIGSVLGPNLSGPGEWVAHRLGLPDLGGAFVISAVVLALGAVAMWIFMRPDPLLTAKYYTQHLQTKAKPSVRTGLRAVWASPTARLAFVAVSIGHSVMAAVMTMTPVHMDHHGASLQLIGLTISVHVLGMYALSPVVGMLSDRLGSVTVVLAGQLIFVASALVSGLGRDSMVMVTIGLFLLGLGWSFSIVAGSTLLINSVDADVRPAVQGASDTSMNVLAAVAAGASGPLQEVWGFGGLNVIGGALTIPVLLLLAMLALTGGARRVRPAS